MKHIVLHAMAGWGHSKPLTSILVRMAESRENIIVTFLVGEMYKNIMDELSKLPEDRLRRFQDRIHIVDIRGNTAEPDLEDGPDTFTPAFDANGLIDPSYGFYPAFEALCHSGTVTCNTSGKSIRGLPRPTVAIIDPFAGCDMKTIHSIAHQSYSSLHGCRVQSTEL
ncbi:hypothetical protein FB451DRAFT_602098 [Mycena latifolia]|nr:hypothetical protein FB451DRAFT_602098 [Mycena latifolia]